MVTQVPNASFSFTFYGTGVQLYGAERANHGLYQVFIDTFEYPQTSGQLNGTERFQTVLFQTAGLAEGIHVLTVVNLGNTTFDVDFITWETSIGQDQESLLSSTIQDSDSSFVYTPASAWNTNPANIGTPAIGKFNGGSAHVTSTAGAYVECTFTGDAVAIYGSVGPQGAPYTVQLDNGATTNYSSFKHFNRPQTLLFQGGNFSSGAHTVRLTSEAGNTSLLMGLAIDYALVFSTPSIQPTPEFTTSSILAIIFGILFALSLMATGYLFFSHWRGQPVNSKTVIPFSQVEYHPVGASPRTPTSYPAMRLSNPGSQVADTNLEANVQVISVPQILDGKYRPDLSPPFWQATTNGPPPANSFPLVNDSPSHSSLHPDMIE